ncbi:acyltransferase, partial [bacterium]|nr:acyltransferase [bacterium]
KKRAIRIYLPIFFIFVILFAITGKGTEYHHDIFNIIRNFFLIQNPVESIHPYSWTLVYEMFYYVTFAFFSILFGWSIYIYVFIIITPIVISRLFGIYYDDSIIFTSFYNLYFLAGVLISYYYNSFKINSSNSTLVLVFFIFLLLPFIIENEMIIFLSTILFFIVYLKRDISNRFLNIIGNASFSIYLVHALVISIGKYIIPDLNFIKFLSLVLFSFLFGYIYHIYFENKIVKEINKKFLKRIK